MPKKICARCKNPFPATEKHFSKHSAQKDGLQPYCRTCQKEKMAEYRAKKKEEEMAKQAKVYRMPTTKEKIKKAIKGKGTSHGIVTEKQEPDVPTKVCNQTGRGCEWDGKPLPNTFEYFGKSTIHKDGINNMCKKCSARKQREGRERRLAGLPAPLRPRHKKKQEPVFLDDGADWVAKGHQVFFKGEVVAIATSDYWATRIIEARQASREAISDKKIVHTIKTLVSKEMTEQLKAKDDEISRLRAIVAHTEPPKEEPKKSLHEIKRNLQMDRDVRLNNHQVNYLIRENKMDVKSVAELAGLTEAHLRQCLSNGHMVKMLHAFKMAELFEVDVATIIARKDQERIPVVEN